MMDLAELRINRTPVSQNSKCEGCVHYDGNAAAKGGACEVGQAPALCGTGGEPKYGYAALADLAPDEIDDLATPQLAGAQGAMNEHGEIEKMIMMKRVVLGDEDLTIAQRIHGELMGIAKKSIGYAQGEVNAFAGAELAQQRYGNGPEHPMITVAKSLHQMYMSPRKQAKYGVSDVLAFLKARGMPVTDDDMELCKSRFGATRQVPVGHADNPTLPQAAAGLRAHNAATRAPGGVGSAPAAPAMRAPRNRTPTQPMAVAKSAPDVQPIAKSDGGGEGSHGGHIIGHTKKGKPIYGPGKGRSHLFKLAEAVRSHGNAGYAHNHEALMTAAKQHVDEHHQGFTKDDHKRAADAHSWEAHDARERANSIHTSSLDKQAHTTTADVHTVLQRAHSEAAQSKSKKVAKSEAPNVRRIG